MLVEAVPQAQSSRLLSVLDIRSFGVTRHLAAVLVADVVGYSRLMGEYDLGTIQRLHDHRSILAHTVAEHGADLSTR